jgi:hypothetical protein
MNATARKALDEFRAAHFAWYRAVTPEVRARLERVLNEKKRAFDAAVNS